MRFTEPNVFTFRKLEFGAMALLSSKVDILTDFAAEQESMIASDGISYSGSVSFIVNSVKFVIDSGTPETQFLVSSGLGVGG
jgi:hypothetical protein